MQTSTKKEIEDTIKYLQQKGYPEVTADLGGNLRFNYFVVSQTENPQLPDFAIAMRGRDIKEGVLLGVSDSLDEKIRKYWAAHEFIEIVQLGGELLREGDNTSTNDCLTASELELSLVPDDIKPGYIKRRIDFFKNLISYAKKNNYPQLDISNFRGSLKKLQDLSHQIKAEADLTEKIGNLYNGSNDIKTALSNLSTASYGATRLSKLIPTIN